MAEIIAQKLEHRDHRYELSLHFDDGAMAEGAYALTAKVVREETYPSSRRVEISATATIQEDEHGRPVLEVKLAGDLDGRELPSPNRPNPRVIPGEPRSTQSPAEPDLARHPRHYVALPRKPGSLGRQATFQNAHTRRKPRPHRLSEGPCHESLVQAYSSDLDRGICRCIR